MLKVLKLSKEAKLVSVKVKIISLKDQTTNSNKANKQSKRLITAHDKKDKI